MSRIMYSPATGPWAPQLAEQPGRKLYDWLHTRYSTRGTGANQLWCQRMETDFDFDGLTDILVRASILTIQRKLINTRKMHHKEAAGDWPLGLARFDSFLSAKIYDPKLRGPLLDLVESAFRAASADITDKAKKAVLSFCREEGLPCGYCGDTLIYNPKASSTQQQATLDHIWPQSLGGRGAAPNLRLSCRQCNSQRQDATGMHDLDFARCHVTQSKHFTNQHKLAIALENNQTCGRCRSQVPEIRSDLKNYQRFRNNESFGLLNTEFVCVDCNGKRKQ